HPAHAEHHHRVGRRSLRPPRARAEPRCQLPGRIPDPCRSTGVRPDSVAIGTAGPSTGAPARRRAPLMTAILENFFDLAVFRRSTTLLWIGVGNLLRLAVAAFLLALVLGILFAAMGNSRLRAAQRTQAWVVDVVRALPPLVSLVIVFYLTPPVYGF